MFGFNLFGSSASTDTPQPTGAVNTMPTNTTTLATPNNAASDLKPQGETAGKVKVRMRDPAGNILNITQHHTHKTNTRLCLLLSPSPSPNDHDRQCDWNADKTIF